MVAAGDSPEALPEGWSVQFSALRSGRKVKCYMNSGTGQKFFSKDDLLRHIKAAKALLDCPQPTNSPIQSTSENNHMNLINHTNENPEWLPHGWITKSKTNSVGRKYKFYIEPLTGRKFNSKPEVFRHIETVGQECCESMQEETCTSMLPLSEIPFHYPDAKVRFEKSTVEDLPAGWIRENKVQRKANGIRKDPFYIDPVSGYMFHSKRDVQRYLESGDIMACKIIPKKRDMDFETSPSSAAKSQKLEHYATGQLMEGQTNTCHKNSDGNSIARRRGRSASALAIVPLASITEKPSQKIPSNNSAESEKNSDANWSAPTMAEEVRGANNCGHRLLISQDEIGIKGDETDKTRNNLSKSSYKKGLNMPRRCSKRLSGIEPEMVEKSVSITQAISEAIIKKEQNSPEGGIKGSIVQGNSEADNNQGHNSAENGINGFSVQALPKIIGSSKCEAIIDVAVAKNGLADKPTEKTVHEPGKELVLHSCTASSPLLGDPSISNQKSDSSFTVQPNREVSSQCKMVNTDDGPVSTPEVDTMQGQKPLERGLKGRSQVKTQNSMGTRRNKKAFNLPRRSSERLAGLKQEFVAKSESSTEALQNSGRSRNELNEAVVSTTDGSARLTSQQIENESLIECPHSLINASNSLQQDPLIKKQVFIPDQAVSKDHCRVLEANKINDQKSESKLVPPIGEFLSDPCLEFAYKTLTGEIPVEMTANNGMVSTPTPDIVDERVLPVKKIDRRGKGKTLTKSTKNKNSSRASKSKKKATDVDLAPKNLANGASQHLKLASEAECAYYGSTNVKIIPQNESTNSRVQHPNNDKSEVLPCFSYGEYWSDPCFDFAYKTLTGAIPVESNLPVQSYFQQQVDASQNRRELVDPSHASRDGTLALPDFGLPGFFKTDISIHFDSPEKQQVAVQPLVPSSNPSFAPSGSMSLPSYSSLGPQQQVHLNFGSQQQLNLNFGSHQQAHLNFGAQQAHLNSSSQQQAHSKENKGLRRKVNSQG
ncbi:methyl-CpG-binding domain-containing protein 13-like isoform X2 [Mercurialis annua]|uniref:methyl-CpG-binding domain-containing protein 13-like isoform X2 n=1 Tax=Mercurialis annua TaxID=3986 RepID=UPI00215ECBB8|nr:methyl-CpG-binding domain-containing protein 13-like isoform X2 [Mercurialis annua]